jgi:hypothetical protein
MMTKEQKNLKAIKKKNKIKKLGCLVSYYSKFLEDGLMPHGVESVCNVYLKHHPIRMGIQSDPNNMDHDLVTFFNCEPEFIW